MTCSAPTLDDFIASQYRRNIFILSKGDLEMYLPDGYRGKDLEKLIRFLEQPNFWDLLPGFAREELRAIVDRIVAL